jgi:vancomycin resistance protein VanW
MNNKLKKFALCAALTALPLSLASVCYATYPFAEVVASKTLSTTGLTNRQKSNIQLAAHSLNGKVLAPGEEFSFNAVVGPRDSGRGYRPAPSYLGPDSPATVGGGVCLVSSAIYQLALETGCKIDERVAHLRTIRTVPAGLDATVWYGQADLKFKNSLNVPVQLTSKWDNNSLTVAMVGRKPAGFSPAKLNLVSERRTANDIVVQVFRRLGDKEELVSRDRYSISQ